MRAVGEALGLGRTFPEAFLKALEGRECDAASARPRRARGEPVAGALGPAARGGAAGARPAGHPSVLRRRAARDRRRGAALVEDGDVVAAKRFGLPDARIAALLGIDEAEVRARRPLPGRLAVDSCAARVRGADAVLLPLVRAVGRRARRRPAARSSCSAPARTGSARGSSSTTAASTRRRRSAARLRGGARQLESRDGLDRLRHLRPALPRAADARARARRLRARAAARRRRLASAARRRFASRPGSPRPACRCSATRSTAIDAAEDRGRFAELLGELGLSAPTWRAAADADEARGRGGGLGYPGARAPASRDRRARHARRAQRRTSSTCDGPCLVDRYLEGALELDVDALCDGERRLGRGDPRARRAGGRPLGRLGLRRARRRRVTQAREQEIRDAASAIARGARRARPAQPPARARGRRALRARGEPARVAHGAVRREGDRAAARRARVPAAARRAARGARPARTRGADARVGEGGGLPERPLRGRGRRAARRCARPAR